MKRQNVRLITAALAAAGIAGCFDDPTSSLRNGPARIQLTRSAAVVPIGDSVLVEARIMDSQGSILPMTGASWTTDNAAVADVSVAAQQLPGDGSSRAYIRGVATLGGITTVRVTARGVTDSIRVTALPTRFLGIGSFAVSGTATADTVPGSSPLVTFTAGDTLTITAPTGMTFSATSSVVRLGATPTFLLARSTSSITVLAIKGYRGQATVTDVTWLGNTTTGDYSLAELNTTDTVTVARARFRGTAAVSTAVYGTNTLLTLTAQAGTTFNTTGTPSGVVFGLTPAMVASRTASTITAIARAGYTGIVKVTNVNVGTVRVDSLFTPGELTVAAATLADANVTVRNGPLGTNTEVKVVPPAGTTFIDTGAATGRSAVVFGANNGTILFRSADSIVVISSVNYTGSVKVTRLISTNQVLDSLRTPSATFAVSGAFFPGTIVQGGSGRLLDTIYVIGGPSADFTTSGTNASNVTINGTQAFIIRRAADTLYAISKLAGASQVAISNVIVGSATVPSLSTSGTTVVSATTGEANEPGNQASSGATAIGTLTNANDSIVVYGVMDGNLDQRDYYSFTMNRASTVSVQLDFFGTGGGGASFSDTNPDFDLVVCTTLSGTGTCSYGQDIIPGNAASVVNNPEAGTTTAIASGTTVFARTFAYYETAAGIGAYRLVVKTP